MGSEMCIRDRFATGQDGGQSVNKIPLPVSKAGSAHLTKQIGLRSEVGVHRPLGESGIRGNASQTGADIAVPFKVVGGCGKYSASHLIAVRSFYCGRHHKLSSFEESRTRSVAVPPVSDTNGIRL